MRGFIKVILSMAFSCLVMLIGYFFVWNYMAKNRLAEIVSALDISDKYEINYKKPIITGYPNNINITLDKVAIKSNEEKYNLVYKLGDVVFNIYPFVLEQQAEITLPNEHFFNIKINGEVKNFKVETTDMAVRFVDRTIGFDLSNVKVYDLESNQKIAHLDKINYTFYLDDKNKLKINFKNILIKNQIIDSTQVVLNLENISHLELFAALMHYIVLDKDDFNAYLSSVLTDLKDRDATFDIENMKWVDNNRWFDFGSKLKLDNRKRLDGPIDIVSNSVETTQDLIRVLIGSDDFELLAVESVKKLQERNTDNLIRINGSLDKGSLEIFNENVSRIKPVAR